MRPSSRLFVKQYIGKIAYLPAQANVHTLPVVYGIIDSASRRITKSATVAMVVL